MFDRSTRPVAGLLMLSLDPDVAGHLAHALRRHIKYARSVGLALPPELHGIESMATLSAIGGHRASQDDLDLRGNHDQNVEAMAVTYTDAALALSVSKRTITRMIQRGELKTVRVGTSKRIPITELDRLTNTERPHDGNQPSILSESAEPDHDGQHRTQPRQGEKPH